MASIEIRTALFRNIDLKPIVSLNKKVKFADFSVLMVDF